jgi:hypothetical protein
LHSSLGLYVHQSHPAPVPSWVKNMISMAVGYQHMLFTSVGVLLFSNHLLCGRWCILPHR